MQQLLVSGPLSRIAENWDLIKKRFRNIVKPLYVLGIGNWKRKDSAQGNHLLYLPARQLFGSHRFCFVISHFPLCFKFSCQPGTVSHFCIFSHFYLYFNQICICILFSHFPLYLVPITDSASLFPLFLLCFQIAPFVSISRLLVPFFSSHRCWLVEWFCFAVFSVLAQGLTPSCSNLIFHMIDAAQKKARAECNSPLARNC